MFQLFGLLMVVVLIAGALVFTGSPALFSALPFELALIGGAGLGTLVIGNSPRVAGDALAGIAKAMRGAKWTRADYADLLSGLNDLLRRARALLEINGTRHPLQPPGLVVGRGSDADLRINDPGISRRHAEFMISLPSESDHRPGDPAPHPHIEVHDLGGGIGGIIEHNRNRLGN